MTFYRLVRYLIKHFNRMENRIMANFDKLNADFTDLSLKVRTAMDDILELVAQLQNQSADQDAVNDLSAKMEALAQNVKDSTDAAATTVAQGQAPAPAPVPAPTPDPAPAPTAPVSA